MLLSLRTSCHHWGMLMLTPTQISALGTPTASTASADRVKGMLLGLAIGDALGNTSESMTPQERRQKHGQIVFYLPHRRANNQQIGLPSDDTQLAFLTVKNLLEFGQLKPDALAAEFAKKRIYGMGRTLRQFKKNAKTPDPWQNWGTISVGNGALMRIAPSLLPHLKNPSTDLWESTAIAAATTHKGEAAISSSVAFIAILWDLLSATQTPHQSWWCEKYVQVAKIIEGNAPCPPRPGSPIASWNRPIWQFVEQQVVPAIQNNQSIVSAQGQWRYGSYILETVPAVLHILALCSNNPDQAIIRAVNDTRDNDTVAAIVGAAVGALHGASKFRSVWLENLSGRIASKDDGTVQKLTDAAVQMFV